MKRVAPNSLEYAIDLIENLALEIRSPGKFVRSRPEQILQYEREAAAQKRQLCDKLVVDSVSWAIARDLYLARKMNEKRNVKQVLLACDVPMTTALRYLRRLVDAGLVTREPSRHDGRVIYLELSDQIASQIEEWTRWLADRFDFQARNDGARFNNTVN